MLWFSYYVLIAHLLVSNYSKLKDSMNKAFLYRTG